MQLTAYIFMIAALLAAQAFILADTLKYLQRNTARELAAANILVMVGLAFFEVSLLLVDSPLKIIFHELKFAAIAFYSPCILVLYSKFVGKTFSNKTKAALCIIPLITVILALTNESHHLFRKLIFVFTYNNATYVGTENSIWFWFYTAYSYVLVLLSFVFILTAHYKKPKIYRDQTMILFFTGFLSVGVSGLSAVGLIRDIGDITLIVFSISTIIQYLVIIKYTQGSTLPWAFKMLSGRPGAVQSLRDMVIRDINNPVLIFDHNLMLVDANKSASAMFGIGGSDYGILKLEKFISDNEIIENEIYLEKEDIYFHISDKSIYGEKGKFTGRLLVLNDITALKRSVNELELIAKTDYLTGAKNRTAFYEAALGITENDLPAAFIAVNICRTKLMNDIFGLEYGDRLIISAAEMIDCGCAGRGICARMNGDEFYVILKNTDMSSAEAFALEARDKLNAKDIMIEYYIEIMSSPKQDVRAITDSLSDRMDKSKKVNKAYDVLDVVKSKISSDERLTELCLRIAERLGLSSELTDRIPLLCMTRDIGMLSMSEQVIKNIGNLNNEQWEDVKLHTIRGHNIAFSSPDLKCVAKEILYHHERYDGYGYPHMLRGEEIPELSRILAAAEFYEARLDAVDAVLQLEKRRNTQFDPKVVDALLDEVKL